MEVKADDASRIEKVAGAAPPGVETFLKFRSEWSSPIIRKSRAKRWARQARTGGPRRSFPPVKMIRDYRTCIRRRALQATAGLHHPLRCVKPLTYEPDAPEGMMNGFLNLFLAVGFARAGFKPSLIEEILEDEFEKNFEFDDGGVLWRQEHYLNTNLLKLLREKSIVSFGSCSFEEPIADLQEIGLL